MTYPPNPEQQKIIDAFATGEDMVIEAGAGTGKTSTLKFLTRARPNDRMIYLAYNASIAREARDSGDFPINTRPMTMHSMAYRWAADQWGQGTLRGRLAARRIPVNESLRILGVMESPLMLGEGRVVQPFTLMRLAMETVKRFCYSAETEPQKWHVPPVNGAEDPEARAAVVEVVLPLARKVWKDVTHPRGQLRFEHDHYLKMWALTEPHIDAEVLMLDEAQDANPLIAGVVSRQDHLQRVAVGDANQSIYGWRGATDFLSQMDAEHRLRLSQSYRFGQPVADEANKWLALLGAKLRLRGAPEHVVTSKVEPLVMADAVLCRTNAEAVKQLMGYHERGVRVSLVGGGNEVRALAEAADELKTRGRTNHRELVAFTSWGMVQEYVEHDAAGADLKVAVKLIDDHGPDAIMDAIDKAVPEGSGEVTVSTAHKAKGREWNRVKVAGDFTEPSNDDEGEPVMPSREDMMLAYVTVTRAQQVLDPMGLEWVRNYLPGGIKAKGLVAR